MADVGGNETKLKDKIDRLWFADVTPGFMEKVSGDLQKDPLFKSAERCRTLAQGIDTMLEAMITINSQISTTELPMLRDRFREDVVKLSTLIHEGHVGAAEQRLADVLNDFESYKSATLHMYSRLTNVVQSFPDYSNDLKQLASNLFGIRAFIMDEKYVVLSADDLKNLAKVVVEIISKAGQVGDDVEHDESVEEIVQSKETVEGKIPGREG